MKFSKFIVIPIIIAVLATIVQVIDQSFQMFGATCPFFIAGSGYSWLTFQAWALYFMCGCDIKGGVQVLISYVSAIVGSIAIIMFAGWLGSVGVPAFWATPLSLLILVIPVICLERVPIMIPPLFIGSGAYFAIMTFQPAGAETTFLNAAGTVIVYCLLGLIFGWITVTLRVAYENKVNKEE